MKPIQKYLCWFHNNTQVTCVPSKDTEEALRGFGITCPLVVVGRGVDTTRFHQNIAQKAYASNGALIPIHVSCCMWVVYHRKEVQLIVESYAAMQNIQQQKTKLVVVGDGRILLD